MIRIEELAPSRWPEVRSLLEASGLPTEDLVPGRLPLFLVALDGDRLIGAAALEPAGDAGLLRSLAVQPSGRGTGVGGQLVTVVERQAAKRGLCALYLLTTTAERFFEHRGYARLAREHAPDAVRETSEFRSVCPSSAVLMTKALAPSRGGP